MEQHNEKPLFWPNLPSSNYSKSVLEWFETNSVHFVPYDINQAMMKRGLKKTKEKVKDANDMHIGQEVVENEKKASDTTLLYP